MTEQQPRRGGAINQRWECRCCDPPVLLAMYDAEGHIQIKVRDRFYVALGSVHATCPRCGTVHVLDLGQTAHDATLTKQPARG